MFKKVQSVAAIDVGSYSIKCCLLAKNKLSYELSRAAIFPTPTDGVGDLNSTLAPFLDSVKTIRKRIRVCL
ncbi:MAG: hypothetical protein WCG06_03340, partial [Candidatus Omnitrophota bacterium]